MTKSALLVIIFLVSVLAGCTGPDAAPAVEPAAEPGWLEGAEWNTTADHAQPLTAGPYGILEPEVHRIVSHDGVELVSAVWRPDLPGGEKVPVILLVSPYHPVEIDTTWWDTEVFVERFVPHGYAFARVGLRGTSDSGGCMEFMGANEQRDLDSVLTFYGGMEWSNGHIGMVGGSYDGAAQWMAAGTGNPHLKTIVPTAAVSDARSWLWPNGTNYGFGPTTPQRYWIGIGAGVGTGSVNEGRLMHAHEQACMDGPVGHAEIVPASLTGDTGAVNDEYWQVRDLRPNVLANYKGSVFLIHGFQDILNVRPSQAFPFLQDVQANGNEVKVVLGQWGHRFADSVGPDGNVRWDHGEVLLRWFDRYLKGNDTATGPAVDVQDSTGAWRTEETWPPSDAEQRILYPGTDGILGDEPAAEGGRSSFQPGEAIQNWWQFEHPIGEEGLRIAGLPRFHATVVPQGPDGVLVAYLYDVDPNGTAKRLTFAVMDLRFHNGGHEPNTVVPGEPIVARMEFQPTDAYLRPGHVLLLEARPWADGPAGFTLGGQVPMELRWGGDQTTLRLPVVSRDVGDGTYPGQPVDP